MDSFEKDPIVQSGMQFAEQVWWTLAKRIVKLAGETYGWDEEQWRTANELFLRPNDYKIILQYSS
uniref:Uncharacterized protein n=1 Tax=viral metagenome TaxID=1070528 RepID=A0A6C0DP86_9ZZZZ